MKKALDYFMEKIVWLEFIALLIGVPLLLFGCSTQGSQPAKAQTQTFTDCTFTFNNIPATGDLITQNQSLESSGQESYAQSPSNPFTVSPQTTANLTRPSVAPDAISTVASGISSIIKSTKGTSEKTSDPHAPTNDCDDCTDGSCTIE